MGFRVEGLGFRVFFADAVRAIMRALAPLPVHYSGIWILV